MAIWRPYDSKRRLKAALERGYWDEKWDMSKQSRQQAEALYR
jgi:hypothetical protein